MSPHVERTVLWHLVGQHGCRTYQDFLRDFEAAARRLAAAGQLPGAVTVSPAQYERWLGGKVGRPHSGARQVLEHMFGLDIDTLLSPASQYRLRTAGADALLYDLGNEIIMTAHATSKHAGQTAARSVDDTSIEQLYDAIAKAARRYPHVSPVESWIEVRRIHDEALALLERTGRPAQEAGIYFVLGETCGVMATVSFDLGHSQAAAEQAGSAYMYGQTIDHHGLSAWAQGMLATIGNWSGFPPARALKAVDKGLAIAPAGTATARLFAIQARAFAHDGNGQAALEAARLARAELDKSAPADEVHDVVGGEFGFPPARLARCLASAHGVLGQADQEITEAELALELYASGPGEMRMPKVEGEAWIEKGHGHLLKGELDAAADALSHVFTIESASRVEGITGRLLGVSSLIAQSERLQAARIGRELTDQIEAFTTDSAASRAPALPAGR